MKNAGDWQHACDICRIWYEGEEVDWIWQIKAGKRGCRMQTRKLVWRGCSSPAAWLGRISFAISSCTMNSTLASTLPLFAASQRGPLLFLGILFACTQILSNKCITCERHVALAIVYPCAYKRAHQFLNTNHVQYYIWTYAALAILRRKHRMKQIKEELFDS